jgi:hypothetical protein
MAAAKEAMSGLGVFSFSPWRASIFPGLNRRLADGQES